MQTDLRLLLLIIGVVLGALIIYKAFREKRGRASPLARHQFEKPVIENTHSVTSHKHIPDVQLGESDPLLEDYGFTYTGLEKEEPLASSEVINEELPTKKVEVLKTEASTVKKSHPEVIALSILPRDYYTFEGEVLLAFFEERKYHYAKTKIFQRCHDNDPEQGVIFSVASLVEPGIFNYDKMPFESYRGLVLWMLYSGKEDSGTFEIMLEEAKELAETLNATVCDDKRQQLTIQGIANMRLKIQEAKVS